MTGRIQFTYFIKAVDLHLSEGVRKTLLLGDDLF